MWGKDGLKELGRGKECDCDGMREWLGEEVSSKESEKRIMGVFTWLSDGWIEWRRKDMVNERVIEWENEGIRD